MEFEFTANEALWPDWVRDLGPTHEYGKTWKIHFLRGSADVFQDVYEGDIISRDSERIHVKRKLNGG
jgi:hypothetical protein